MTHSGNNPYFKDINQKKIWKLKISLLTGHEVPEGEVDILMYSFFNPGAV